MLSVKELSVWIGIKEKTIYSWLGSGRLPHRKLGSRVLFCPKEIEVWLATLQRGPKSVKPLPWEADSATKR
jgi:excisionase family DNA binding protein